MSGFCAKCCGWCKKLHWDSILSYSTIKIVQIRDKRLGILHYFFMFIIIGYIIGFTVFYQKRYLLLSPPVGSVRVSLMSETSRTGKLPPPPEDIPYCTYGNHTSWNGFPTMPCLYWDEDLVVFPVTEQTAMFISTRVNISNQTLTPTGCNLTEYNCVYQDQGPSNIVYIAAIENFTMMIDHSMYVTRLGIQADSIDLPGVLYNNNGDEMGGFKKPNVVGVAGKADIMTVQLILHAAGISTLDDPSGQEKFRSMRNNGVVLLMFITYTNTYTYNTDKIRYEYNIKEVIRTKFKSTQPVYSKDLSNRLVWDRHGIRVLYLQVGFLGVFDFPTLLLTFVSGLGLLAVSTFIVDFLALQVLPTKKLYQKYKYQETPEYEKAPQTATPKKDEENGTKGVDGDSEDEDEEDRQIGGDPKNKGYQSINDGDVDGSNKT